MTAAEFLLELMRRAGTASKARDPLADTRRFLERHGDTGEGQALRRVLMALATRDGDFAESDVWLFSAHTLGLVEALVDTRLKGLYSEQDWRDAT